MNKEYSQQDRLAMLPKEERDKLVDSLTPEPAEAPQHDWKGWARPKQLLCFSDDWSTFMYLCGRGYGKNLDKSLPINTLQGWKTLGEITVGEKVFDEQGNPTTVLGIEDIEEDDC